MDYIEKAVEQLESDSITPITPERRADVQRIKYGSTKKIPVDERVLQENRVLNPGMPEEVAMAYKLLRTRVLQRMRQHEWVTLAVTSPAKNAGKTLTAINLAISMAEKLDYTVLLVDLDFRKPTVRNYLNLEVDCGLSDYLLSDIPLHDILVNPGLERLVVLPQRERISSPSELLASPKMAQLVEEIRNRYPSRIVIFDMPPIMVADDVVAFSTFVDSILLVVEDGETTTDELRTINTLLDSEKIIGTVLNKADSAEDTGGYGYY